MESAGWLGIGWEWWILYGEVLGIGGLLCLSLVAVGRGIVLTLSVGFDGVFEKVKELEYAVRETSRD